MNIIKIETSQGSLGKNIGCEEAPGLIVKELKLNADSIDIINNNLEETNNSIYEKAKSVKGNTIFIGGDHSITYSTFKAFAEGKKNPGLIIFDAHIDGVNNFNPPTHEDFLKVLVETRILKPENIILIGTRAFNEIETDFLNKYKIQYYKPEQIFTNMEDVCDVIMEKAREFSNLYISLDIDVLDPAYAPGTGYPEINGLNTQQLFYFLKRLKLLKNLEWFDLVEINPKLDLRNITIKTGAEIIKSMLQ
ncbi:MAG: arginase family protein [Candidatus Nanoarchaeia archaeon]|nr:arginase family protein [Candidatus Nanoarchaeia archaeon]MDD5587839.1 arginase family protein [Candidatus Nanoarchaeia archaeon]